MVVCSATGSKNHHTFYLHVNENSTSTSNNTSSLSWSLTIASTSWNWSSWGTKISYSVNIDGQAFSGYIPTIPKNQDYTIATGSLTVGHNADGTKRIGCSFSIDDNANQSYTSGDASGYGEMDLTKIPRYANFTSHYIEGYDETAVTVYWGADASCDYLQYSLNNGSWKDASGYPRYTVGGLSPNTSYNIKTRVRRADSQLWTETGNLSFKTYSYPYANSMPNFTIGNTLTIGVYNPLGRTVNVYFVCSNGTELGGDQISGTSISGYTGSYFTDAIYASIPNSQSATYKVKIVYGNNSTTKTGGTYSINSNNCAPSVGSLSYKDSNSTTTAITENNQRIIRNNSNLLFTAGTATAKKSASISKYEITFNGTTKSRTSAGDFDFGKVNVSNNLNATLKVTDSRGLTATKAITVIVDNWILPTGIINLKRKNNFEDETYLKVQASYSSLNSKNSVTIKYQYKQTSASTYSTAQTIADNSQITLSLTKESAWDFKITITDKIGTTTYNTVLSRGRFIFFVDTKKLSVGINCFPVNSESLEINGIQVLEYDVIDNW